MENPYSKLDLKRYEYMKLDTFVTLLTVFSFVAVLLTRYL